MATVNYDDYRSFGLTHIKQPDYNHFARLAHHREAAMLLGIPIIEHVQQQSGMYNRYGDAFDYVNGLQSIELHSIKNPQSDGSIVVEAYHDPHKQVYHIIYKDVDGSFSYIRKDRDYNIIVKKTNVLSLEEARDKIKSISYEGAIDGRWCEEKDMYIKNHFKPVKIVEHELTYEPPYKVKKTFKKQLEEEVSGWCKGILNGLL